MSRQSSLDSGLFPSFVLFSLLDSLPQISEASSIFKSLYSVLYLLKLSPNLDMLKYNFCYYKNNSYSCKCTYLLTVVTFFLGKILKVKSMNRKIYFLLFLIPLFSLFCGRLVPIYAPAYCATCCLVSISQAKIHIWGQFKKLLQTIIILRSVSMIIISS